MSRPASEMAASRKPVRMRLGAAAFTVGVLSVTGAGLGEALGGTILVSDVVVVLAVCSWWLRGRLGRAKRPTAAVVASTCTALLGIGAIYSVRDAVLLGRLAALPVLALLAWRIATCLPERRLVKWMLAATAIVSLFVLAPAVANLGTSTVEPSAQIDRAYSVMYPREDSGFVFTSGSVIRSRGTFSHPNEAGGVVSVLAVTSAGIALWGREYRVSAVAAGLLGFSAVAATGSRAAVMGAALGVLLLFLYRIRGGGRRRATRVVTRVAIAALLVALVVGISSHADRDDRGTYGSRILSIADVGSDESVEDRGVTIAASARAMGGFPIGGGLERFNDNVGTAHNSLLFVGAVFGVPFAALGLVAFTFSARLALRAIRQPIAARTSALAAPLGAAVLVWLAVAMAEDRPESAPSMALGAIVVGMTVALCSRSEVRNETTANLGKCTT